jgi:hypothetical protein
MAKSATREGAQSINNAINFALGAVKRSKQCSSNRYVLRAKGRARKFKKSHRDGE